MFGFKTKEDVKKEDDNLNPHDLFLNLDDKKKFLQFMQLKNITLLAF